jgi:hemerythrin-like domain-containing protein
MNQVSLAAENESPSLHIRESIMQSTETLKYEHRVIEMVLEGLEKLAVEVEAGQALDKEKATKALEIIRNFADRCHHTKEEQHLFVLMAQRGVPTEGGPLGVMLAEHEQGRTAVAGMARNLDKAAAGDREAGQRFAENARKYINLLRQHIWKEDNVLYPMAEQVLNAEDDRMLDEAFEGVERNEMGEGTHEKYHQWAREISGKEI